MRQNNAQYVSGTSAGPLPSRPASPRGIGRRIPSDEGQT